MLLLDLFTCPRCQQRLAVMDVHTGLVCTHCQLVYPIREEIPFLTREAAVSVTDWQQGKRQIRVMNEANL